MVLDFFRFDRNKKRDVYEYMSRAIGIVYLIAIIPWCFEISGICGSEGLQPFARLLSGAWQQEGLLAVLRFPSLLWLIRSDAGLYLMVAGGILGATGLVFHTLPMWSALLAWVCFTSIVVVGGDFTVIIIDLFLSEAGALLLLLYALKPTCNEYHPLVKLCFLVLNFRLWFSMGMIKFFLPGSSWLDLTFFENFFPYQPMPTPAAYYLLKLPRWTFALAEGWLLVSQILVPFFVFGLHSRRVIAFVCFSISSILIMISGNYGYFNWLSVIMALPLLDKQMPSVAEVWRAVRIKRRWLPTIGLLVCGITLVMQLVYCVCLFDLHPRGYQNHFNTVFLYADGKHNVQEWLSAPFRPFVFARVCNPYGVFKSIPDKRIELRFSGSYNGLEWKDYEFRFVPSANTQALKWFAPYYPRLDHLLFYESIHSGGYNFNLLNPYYTTQNVWTGRFLASLYTNNHTVTRLLSHNPFKHSPPVYLKCTAYRLRFGNGGIHKAWKEETLGVVYTGTREQITYAPLMENMPVP